MNVTELLARLLLSFVALLILTRIMGRKEISQMTFFNFVSAISIGTIGGSLVIDQTLSITRGMIALAGWTVFTIIMGMVDLHSRKARKLINGDPIILIKNGKIIEKALRKTRLDLDSLKVMLRREKVFSLADVEYAVFETNGKLSVMKNTGKQPVTKNDMKMYSSPPAFPAGVEMISEGIINEDNLKQLHLTKEWLTQQLKNQGYPSADEIFYAEACPNGKLYIDQTDPPH
ncbi:DUF421 domain-containing protein [Halobacillus rhizosphaerae]|uniref:YetF domain-containing protein n=1 Tax=Halobacillus rhizosphaerae TaxID=3064889 RepID=UPI00398AAD8E